MNIFFLDNDPALAAQYHCNKHVVKMILESAQMLSTAHRVHGNTDERLYKSTHINHPCSKWVRENSENYKYLYTLYFYLCSEYTHRYGKIHSSERLKDILKMAPVGISLEHSMSSPALAMPDQFKTDNAVNSYREYYRTEKKPILQYTNRSVPDWLY